MQKDKSLCAGCRYDFYNTEGSDIAMGGECWSFKNATVKRRWKQGWWVQGDAPGAFVEVETLSCYHQPGHYGFSDSLPDFAVNPKRLTDA